MKFPILDGSGAVKEVGTIGVDISSRKQAEERFRHFFELPLIGSAIYAPDKRWIEVNDKLCDLFGYTRDDLMGLT